MTYTYNLDWLKLARSSGLGTERDRFGSLSPPVRPNRAPGLRWMRIHVHILEDLDSQVPFGRRKVKMYIIFAITHGWVEPWTSELYLPVPYRDLPFMYLPIV